MSLWEEVSVEFCNEVVLVGFCKVYGFGESLGFDFDFRVLGSRVSIFRVFRFAMATVFCYRLGFRALGPLFI